MREDEIRGEKPEEQSKKLRLKVKRMNNVRKSGVAVALREKCMQGGPL